MTVENKTIKVEPSNVEQSQCLTTKWFCAKENIDKMLERLVGQNLPLRGTGIPFRQNLNNNINGELLIRIKYITLKKYFIFILSFNVLF